MLTGPGQPLMLTDTSTRRRRNTPLLTDTSTRRRRNIPNEQPQMPGPINIQLPSEPLRLTNRTSGTGGPASASEPLRLTYRTSGTEEPASVSVTGGPSQRSNAEGKRPVYPRRAPKYYYEQRETEEADVLPIDREEPVIPTKHSSSKRIVTVKSSSSKTLSKEDKNLRGLLLLIGSQARAYQNRMDTISEYIKVLEKLKPKEDDKKKLVTEFIGILNKFNSILAEIVVFFKNLVDRSDKIRSIKDIPLLPDEFLEVYKLFEELYREYFNLQKLTPIESLNIVYPTGRDLGNNHLIKQTLNPLFSTIVLSIKDVEKELKENGGGKIIKEDTFKEIQRISQRINLMLPENNYEEQPGSSSQHAAAGSSSQHAAAGSSNETPRANSAPVTSRRQRIEAERRPGSFPTPPKPGFKYTSTPFVADASRREAYGQQQVSPRVPSALGKKPAAKPARHGGKKTKKTKKIKMKHKKKMNRKKTKKIKMKHKKKLISKK